jgi:superfamily II DNA or RNA helicase
MTYKNEIDAEKGQLFYRMKVASSKEDWKQYHAIKAAIKKLEDNEYVCLFKNNQFPTGLLNIAIESLSALNASYELVDERQSPGETAILRWNNAPWEPRYYQNEMIKLGLEAGRGVFEAAVGSGKSLVMANLIKHNSCRSLVIVPSRGLSGQLFNDFSEWFGAGNVELLDAQKIRKLKRPKAISIVTVQSLGSLVKTGEFKDFAKWIDAVYVDEVHHAGASTYTNLLKDLEHVYYRYGFSGTFLRNDAKTLEMWSFLSNVLYEYPAHRAIQEGFLTPLEVHMYNMDGRSFMNYQKEYDHHYCENFKLFNKIGEIASHYGESQILVLVNKKDKCGLVVHEFLKSVGIENSYISGDNSKDEINDTIALFNDKKIRVLIGSSVIGEGIDIRSTDHLIMCNGGKSEITMVQAAGRVLRLYEGKTKAFIHDFRFNGSKYMSKHADEREDIYVKNFKCPIIYI